MYVDDNFAEKISSQHEGPEYVVKWLVSWLLHTNVYTKDVSDVIGIKWHTLVRLPTVA
jgi:hypothetical protein